jgi:hypothetical protein
MTSDDLRAWLSERSDTELLSAMVIAQTILATRAKRRAACSSAECGGVTLPSTRATPPTHGSCPAATKVLTSVCAASRARRRPPNARDMRVVNILRFSATARAT